MRYSEDQILSFWNSWRNAYEENDNRGEKCINLARGDCHWSPSVEKTRQDQGEESLIFNLMSQHLLRAKGEDERIELSLQIKVNGDVDPKILKEGKHVLERIILSNENLIAFNQMLANTYDYGYGVLQVTTKQISITEPFEEIFLRPIKDPRKAFFDVQCNDDNKIEGRYCGLKYTAENAKGKIVEIMDFWWRDPIETSWWFCDDGKWRKEKQDGWSIHRKVTTYQCKYIQLIDGKAKGKPVDYYSGPYLPMVYWKGMETYKPTDIYNDASSYDLRERIKTIPFVYPLWHTQILLNALGSAMVGQFKQRNSSKAILTSDMIQPEQRRNWENYSSAKNLLILNKMQSDGQNNSPILMPPDPIDPSYGQSFQIAIQVMEIISGATSAQQGAPNTAATASGQVRQIFQGGTIRDVLRFNHLRNVLSVGKIFKYFAPEVLLEQRNIGQGLVINQMGENHTPSSPQIRNDIKELFSEKVDTRIIFGASSEIEKAMDAQTVKDIMQFMRPEDASLLSDLIARSSNSNNAEVLKRRIEALIPKEIRQVGDGEMTLEEYDEIKKQQQAEQQQQPNIQQQQLEVQKQKNAADQEIKQGELQLKAQKMQNQTGKDQAKLQLSAVQIATKAQQSEQQQKQQKREGNK